jgi:hypothetical protein
LNFIAALREGTDGKTPTDKTASAWAVAVKDMGAFPACSDTTMQLTAMTPYDGKALPGKLALAPDMTILKYWTGVSNTPGLDAIEAHAAAHPSGK